MDIGAIKRVCVSGVKRGVNDIGDIFSGKTGQILRNLSPKKCAKVIALAALIGVLARAIFIALSVGICPLCVVASFAAGAAFCIAVTELARREQGLIMFSQDPSKC